MVAFTKRTRIAILTFLSSVIVIASFISIRHNHHKAVLDYLDKYARLKILQILYPEEHFTQSNYTSFQFLDPIADTKIFKYHDENDEINPNYEKENATFFSLVRNEELYLMLQSITHVEERFNKKYHYPWIFANDAEFTDTFKNEVSNLVSGNVTFVTIPKEYWSYPEFIDQKRAADVRKQMQKDNIKYGGSESYRHMCRFNSGFFYKLKAFEGIKYYWRVEPDIKFTCDLNYDYFKFMRENNKKYAFTMTLHELHNTVYGLFEATKEFFHDQNPSYIAKENTIDFITLDNEETFNMCHYWSNFELGDLDFLRSKEYEEYFQYLDSKGGFFYERWGDAPIHTFAVSYLLNKNEVHYFDNTGYYHVPHTQCPRRQEVREELHCVCSPNYDYNWGNRDSCLAYWYEARNEPRPDHAPRKTYSTHKPKENENKKRDLEEWNDQIEENDDEHDEYDELFEEFDI